MSRLKALFHVGLIEIACRAWDLGDWCEEKAAALTGKVVRLPQGEPVAHIELSHEDGCRVIEFPSWRVGHVRPSQDAS